jgi:hypothetical protein
MTIFTEDGDFTMRDFEALDTRGKSLQLSVFPDYNVDNEADYLNFIRSKIAFQGSRNDHYIYRARRESFVATMMDRRSAIYHGRKNNYRLAGAQAATASLLVTLVNGPLPGTITFNIGDVVKTDEVPVATQGEIQAQVIMAAGDVTATLSWEHSLTKSAQFTSNNKPNQTFYLPEAPYLDGSASFTTGAGAWTEVENFLSSGPTDRHFVLLVDQNDNGVIYTGDGRTGAIPDGIFTVNYKTGGGISGNVAAGMLARFGTQYTDSLGNSAILTVTNESALNDGEDRETVNQARVNIPNNRTLPRTTVARTDYEVRALEQSGVGRALMLTIGEDSTVPDNEGRLYIVPTLGGTPTQAILDAVYTAVTVTYPGPVTFTLDVLGATYLTLDIRAVIWFSSGANKTTVKTAIQSGLAYFLEPIITAGNPIIGTTIETSSGVDVELSTGMANPQVDFGYNYRDEDDNPAGEIAWSDVFNVVRDVTGVRKIGPGEDDFTINGNSLDVTIENHKFPALGTVTVIDGATGTVL